MMLGAWVLILISAASEPASKPIAIPLDNPINEPWAPTWDANVEGGVGVGLPVTRFAVLGRARLGLMVYRFPWHLSLGGTYEITNRVLASFGLQAEMSHNSTGIWVQAGGSVSTHAAWGAMLSAGWSVVGVEAQWRQKEDFALLAKVRIPVRFIVMALTGR